MKKNEKIWWSEEFAFGENAPLFMSVSKTQVFVEAIERNIADLKKLNSARHVILETWLVLDYFVRCFIISGFDLEKYSTKEMNLEFSLLPQSFRDCLDFLQEFIKNQEKLQYDVRRNAIDLHGLFARFVFKEHKDFYDKQFIPIVENYYEKYHPELVGTSKKIGQEDKSHVTNINTSVSMSKIIENQEYRQANETWLKSAIVLLNNDFFKKAEKINSLRNTAVHNLDSNYIYQKLGILGKNEEAKFAKLKKFCVDQLAELLDIYVPKK